MRAASAIAMKVVVNLLRDYLADAGRGLEIGEPGRRDALGRAEAQQQRLLAARADAGNLVELRAQRIGGTARAVGADRKAMRLVAQALQEEEPRGAGRELLLGAVEQVKRLAS